MRIQGLSQAAQAFSHTIKQAHTHIQAKVAQAMQKALHSPKDPLSAAGVDRRAMYTTAAGQGGAHHARPAGIAIGRNPQPTVVVGGPTHHRPTVVVGAPAPSRPAIVVARPNPFRNWFRPTPVVMSSSPIVVSGSSGGSGGRVGPTRPIQVIAAIIATLIIGTILIAAITAPVLILV